MALAISPLLADAPWDLSYAQLRAVVQNFRASNKPDKPVPRVGLIDAARKAQAPQAIPNSRVENSRTVRFDSTTETIPTATRDARPGILLKHTNLVPVLNISGREDSAPRHKVSDVPVHATSLDPRHEGRSKIGQQVLPKPIPRKIDANVKKHDSPAIFDKMDVEDEWPSGIRLPARDLLSHRPNQVANGSAAVSMALPAPRAAKKDEARGRLKHEQPKQVLDTSSSGEDDNRVEFDEQQIRKRHRTSSESSEVVPKPNDAKSVQAADGIRAAVPCDQCKKAGVEFECFTFPKISRRRACSRCHKKKKGCSFISGFTQAPKRNNGESSSDSAENVVNDDFMRQVCATDHIQKGALSNHAEQEPARGDVTKRMTKVENMVNDLQSQVKIIQDNVVTMDSRIEDVFEGTKSMTRVMKRFETRSEQVSWTLEKLVERVERL